MLIARAFSGFPTWIKLYINSCDFLKNGPLCGPLTFDRSPNMVRRSAHLGASFLTSITKKNRWRLECNMIMQLEFERHSMLYHLKNFAFIFAHDHEPFSAQSVCWYCISSIELEEGNKKTERCCIIICFYLSRQCLRDRANALILLGFLNGNIEFTSYLYLWKSGSE